MGCEHVKVTLWTVNDDVYLCAASTSGYVFLWKASKSTELLCKVIFFLFKSANSKD